MPAAAPTPAAPKPAARAGAASEFPRRFVAPGADLRTWDVIEPYYRQLSDRPITSLADFERWLLDASELESVLGEESSQRYIAMTCDTGDAQRKQDFLFWVEEIAPKCEPWQHTLRLKYVEYAKALPLPAQRYDVLTRSTRAGVELFRVQNIPLQVEDAKLSQQYQELTGAMSATYRGEEMTLQKLASFLEEPDRKVREETWRLATSRYLQDAGRLDALYVEMVKVRHQIALNADLPDYRAYAFKEKQRFDYTPEDCLAFHDAIAQVCVPAVSELAAERKRKLGLDTLRPWDFEVDPDGAAPLRPFRDVDQLVAGCSRIFHQIDPDLGKQFDRMRTDALLDLDSRKGKAPGGYQAVLGERRLPFIFMNAVGTEGDVKTLLHEGGHSFHTFACQQEPLLPYRHSPMEFAEVASMSMECLALPLLGEFFGVQTDRARRKFFTKIVQFMPYMARVDAYQHHVYTHVTDTIDAWKDQWQKLTVRLAPHLDYRGLEAVDRHSWHQKLHFFTVPFYYIEYGIAQLGALQVWMNSRKDFAQAVAWYRYALSLGGSQPLPKLFEAAGLKWDFSKRTLQPLIEACMEEVRR